MEAITIKPVLSNGYMAAASEEAMTRVSRTIKGKPQTTPQCFHFKFPHSPLYSLLSPSPSDGHTA